jgi:hypothetical protein
MGMLNVKMDNLAKVYWNDMSNKQVGNCSITNKYWPVYIRGEKTAARLDEHIWEHILGSEQCEWWERKGHLTKESISRVNWKACKKVMKSLAAGRRHWIVKHGCFWACCGRCQYSTVADAGICGMPEVQGCRRQPPCMDLPCARHSMGMDATNFKARHMVEGAGNTTRSEKRVN